MSMIGKRFESPDDLRTPPGARISMVNLGSTKVAQFAMEPGWRWSESVKPIAGTDTCQARHVGVMVSGRLRVLTADGSEAMIDPGTAYVIEPGHDAWVEGDEPAISYEFETTTAETFAKT